MFGWKDLTPNPLQDETKKMIFRLNSVSLSLSPYPFVLYKLDFGLEWVNVWVSFNSNWIAKARGWVSTITKPNTCTNTSHKSKRGRIINWADTSFFYVIALWKKKQYVCNLFDVCKMVILSWRSWSPIAMHKQGYTDAS